MEGMRTEQNAIVLDEDGHLAEFDHWDRKVAQWLADRDCLGNLNEKHFQVFEVIRTYYSKHKVAPMLHLLCRECSLSYREMHDLFQKQPGKRAAKLAGLPRSTGCV